MRWAPTLAALVACIGCSSGGNGGAGGAAGVGGSGGGGGGTAGAGVQDAGAEADADAATEPVLFEKLCNTNDNRLLLPGRTLTELAFAHPFVRIVAGDNGTCCFQWRAPTFIADGAVGLNDCVPIGGTSIAGNRLVTWYVPKTQPVETFEVPCSATYHKGSNTLPFAEQAFPGKTIAELSAVHAVVQQSTPAFVYTTNSGDTEFYAQRPGQMFLRDGSVAVVCGAPEDTVTFVVPTTLTSPVTTELPCDTGVAEWQYPGATFVQLASVRAVRQGLDNFASVGTAAGVGDLYQIDISDLYTRFDDGSWTKKTPFVSVQCKPVGGGGTVAGPVTFVAW